MLTLHEQYLINQNGEKSAVLLPLAEWQQILQALEEYQDICAYDAAKKESSDPVDWDEALKLLKK